METQSPLRVAKERSVLLLISTTADWSHVEFQDPEHGRRAGYVERKFVRISSAPGSAALASSGSAAQQVLRPPTTTNQPIASIGRPQTREGFWFNGGLGYGWLGCQGGFGREGGFSGGLSAGGAVSPRVLLGVGTSGWYKSVDGVTLTGGTLDGRIRFYPVLRSGFFLTGGLGLGNLSLGVNGFGSETEYRVGALFGVGWDLRVGRNVSLTPFYNGFAVQTENVDANVGQIGVGITIH